MHIQKIVPLHKDKRGLITALFDLVDNPGMRSVLLITSKKGAIRANHYHKKDTHYTYLLSGSFEYIEQEKDDKNKRKVYTMKPGDMMKTEPGNIHAMRFLKNSIIIVFTTEDRNPKAYEQDTVRVSFIK